MQCYNQKVCAIQVVVQSCTELVVPIRTNCINAVFQITNSILFPAFICATRMQI